MSESFRDRLARLRREARPSDALAHGERDEHDEDVVREARVERDQESARESSATIGAHGQGDEEAGADNCVPSGASPAGGGARDAAEHASSVDPRGLAETVEAFVTGGAVRTTAPIEPGEQPGDPVEGMKRSARSERTERETLDARAPSERRGRRGIPIWLERRIGRQRRARRDPEGIDAQGERFTGPERGLDWQRAGELDSLERLHPLSVGPPRDLEESGGRLGTVFARRTRRDAEHRHGRWSLTELFDVDSAELAWLVGDETLREFDLSRALFLDTETTGLSGGAGVYVYMVGLGRFEPDGGFEVWQSFLPDPGAEAAMLAEVAERVAAASGIVSFFGKSFDRHRLEDKMRIHGIEPPFAELPHLDLYHPLSRLTKGAFPDGRLATMESRLVGVERTSDLPGALAPAAWFDYLAGRGHRLEGVFQHNLDDVLSLVTLAAYLGRVHARARRCGEPLEGPPGLRAWTLAKAALASKERERALAYLDEALAAEWRDAAQARRVAFERAELLRGAKRCEEARAAFADVLAGADALAVEGALALAKLEEHVARDREAALAAVERAEVIAAGLGRRGVPARLRADLERRGARLRERLS